MPPTHLTMPTAKHVCWRFPSLVTCPSCHGVHGSYRGSGTPGTVIRHRQCHTCGTRWKVRPVAEEVVLPGSHQSMYRPLLSA